MEHRYNKTGLFRLCRAEQYKMKHTFLPWIHVIVPLLGSAVFLLYYRISIVDPYLKVAAFIQVMGMAFPFLAGIVCARAEALEEENHFQTFLGGSPSRTRLFLAKCTVLQLKGLLAVCLGVGTFALGAYHLLGYREIPLPVYWGGVVGLWLGSLVLYPIHLGLGLRFSRSIAMGVGVAESVLSALMLTGLGEGIWQFLPCSWSIRLSGYWMSGRSDSVSKGSVAVLVLILLLVYGIILVWFRFFEGRVCED